MSKTLFANYRRYHEKNVTKVFENSFCEKESLSLLLTVTSDESKRQRLECKGIVSGFN